MEVISFYADVLLNTTDFYSDDIREVDVNLYVKN